MRWDLGKPTKRWGFCAAVKNSLTTSVKFLIVCPTSVIYHWEALLAKFLPHVRAYLYYGIGRKLSDFTETQRS